MCPSIPNQTNGRIVLRYSFCFIFTVSQDLYVDRLVEQVDKLREDIAITEAQLTAQLEETKAAKEALSEASMEIEVAQNKI